MEASRPQPPATPPPPEPPAATQPPASPPPTGEPGEGKAGAGPRILAVVGGLVWGIMGVALIVVGFDIIDAPLCGDPEALAQAFLGEECYDGSSTQRFFDLLFGFPAGILGVVTAGLAVYFAATGRRGRLLVQVAIAALVLFGGSLLVGAL
jgi:hypothetical protein